MDQSHLLQQITGAGKLINDEKGISYIQAYVSAHVGIVRNVARHSFPCPVGIEPYQLSLNIYYRAAGITSGRMIVSNETYRHLPAPGIRSVVFRFI